VPAHLRIPVEYDIEALYIAPLPSPRGLVMAASGDLYTGAAESPFIYRVTPSGDVSIFAALPLPAHSLARNSQGELFAAGPEIWKVSPRGRVTTFFSLSPLGISISHIDFGPDGGLYGIDWHRSSPDIRRISPQGEITTFATGLSRASDINFSPSGELFVADPGAGKVFKVDRQGKMTTVVEGIWSDPTNIAFDSKGDLLLATGWRGKREPGLYRLSLSDGFITPIAVGAAIQIPLEGMLYDGVGNIWGVDVINGGLYKVSPDGTIETLARGWHNGMGLAISPSGDIFVADHSLAPRGPGRIFRIEREGNASLFADGLEYPFDITFDPSGNLFVAEHWAGEILRIPPEGKIEVVAEELHRPQGVAFDRLSGDLFVFTAGDDKVWRIGPQGRRTVVSVDFGKDVFSGRGPVDHQGNLYVSVVYAENYGTGPTLTSIFKVSLTGQAKLLAQFSDDVPAAETDLAVGPSGSILVLAHPLDGFAIRKVTPDGNVSVFAERLPVDHFAIAVAKTGDIFFNNSVGIFRMSPIQEGIVIDGKRADWQGFSPISADPQGDAKGESDLKSFYGFTDGKFVYLMTEFYGSSQLEAVNVSLDFDGDKNPDYRLEFIPGQAAVGLLDMEAHEEVPRRWFGLCQQGEVLEMKMPLSYLADRGEFHVLIDLVGKENGRHYSLDTTEWAYVRPK
jgi:sugar lactone lactonase YvrE